MVRFLRTSRAFSSLAGFLLTALMNFGAPSDAHGAEREEQPGRQNQTGQDRSWRDQHPMLFATLIGTAAGAAVGCALGAAGQHSEDVSCPYLMAPFGLLGAAIGSVSGMATERRHERNPLTFEDVKRRVKSGTPVMKVNQDRHETVGKVVEASGDSLTIRADDGTTTTVAGSTSTWHLRSDSLTNGILIGAGLGTAGAVFNYKDGAGVGAIIGVPIWALIGALTDRAFKHERLMMDENPARSSASIHVTPWFGFHRAGIALQAAF